jgi:hypothetical protein
MANTHVRKNDPKDMKKNKWTGTYICSVLYKDEIDIQFRRLIANDASPLSEKERVVRHSSTALYDKWAGLSEDERESLRLRALTWQSDEGEATKYL